MLLPFLATDQEGHSAGHHWSNGVQRLWHSLDGDPESRWGIDRLSLGSSRLETATERNNNGTMCEPAAFSVQIYRAGWHFDGGRAQRKATENSSGLKIRSPRCCSRYTHIYNTL
jgi:hypothetical protein